MPRRAPRERRFALEELASLADDSFQFAALHLRRLMYGDHPYGRPSLGNADALPGLSREDLLAHYRRQWNPRNLTVVVSGDVDPDRLLPHLESVLSDLPGKEAPHRAAKFDA